MNDRPSNLEKAVNGFLDHIGSTQNLSSHTTRAYRSDLQDFLSFVGGEVEMTDCRQDAVKAYVKEMLDGRGLKATSVKRRIASLRLLFSWLEDEGWIGVSPFHRLKMRIRLPQRLPRVLTRDELRALMQQSALELGFFRKGAVCLDGIESCVEEDRFERLVTWVSIEVLFATGIRVGELVSIRLADIDLRERTITVLGKGNRQRQVFLPETELEKLIAGYLATREKLRSTTDRFLVSHSGVSANTQHVRSWIRRCAQRAGISRPITPHMLRHTSATFLLEAGLDIRFVQRLLGHSTIATTQIYTAVSNQHLKSQVMSCGARARVWES